MRATLAASLLIILPAALGAQPALAQGKRGAVYISLMGEPFVAPAGQSPLALWLARADLDRSGSVSLAELTADADRFFKTLDVDGDGRIGGEEMTRYEEQIAPASLRAAGGARPVGYGKTNADGVADFASEANVQRAARQNAPDGKAQPAPRPSSSMSESDASILAAIPQPVAMTDVDMSGSVTTDEFARAAARRFGTLDANKNGLLEYSELSARKR